MSGDGSFAVALRVARHAAGLTLEELAEASGVSVRALSNMERGRALGPQRRTVALIADALKLGGVRRDEFVALAKAGRTRPAYVAAAPGLCELPGSIGDFTGRAAELAWIFRLADALDESADRSNAAVISGGAGLGKTTLVVRAAHRLRDRFPGGVHFLDALGMSARPVGSDEILTRVLRALGVRDQQIPEDAAERAGRYRQLLRQKRVLVVVDDATSEAQVRPLIPGGGHSQLLVTSRRLLAGLEGVHRLHLDPMPAADASELLRRILAERADVPDDHDVQDLVDLLGGLPLAVRIVGNRLVSRPIWSAGDLVARLSVDGRRLDQLSAGDLKVAAAFDMSYEQLPDAARQLFRRAALVPGPDFSAALAAVLGGVAVPVAEDQLDDLVDLGLMEIAEGGRYRFHDLVRLYAQQRLEREDSADTVIAVRRQMVSWLLATVTAAGGWFGPDAGRSADPVFASAEDAKAWIRIEAEHWSPALGAAAVDGDHHALVRAASALQWFAEHWVHWPRWLEVFTLAFDSAVALGDAGLQAEFLNHIVWVHTLPWRKDLPTALGCAQRALGLARQAGNVRQEGWALMYIGAANRGMSDLEAALTAVRQAAVLLEQAGNVRDVSQALLARGTIAFDLGDVSEALAAYQRALALVEDPASGMTAEIAEAELPHVLGLTARALGRVGRRDEAVPMMLRAVDLFGRLQVFMGQAAWLRILGEELYDEDHAGQARASLLQAADLYESVGQHDRAERCRAGAAAIEANTNSA
ncbi:ATP-binding protein [Micromonospora viridifaciens]|uniref:ATP-binding protein n=1 Tax=Micromonospora viridifaciens TaxID=1881 RepID=UPI000B5AC49E|nr:NB-ARC domain-containing protein [Micromonospora viridifaciens]